MINPTQTCVESTTQDERTDAPVQKLQVTQTMRQLKLEELRAYDRLTVNQLTS